MLISVPRFKNELLTSAVRGSVCKILGGLEGENLNDLLISLLWKKWDKYIFKGTICTILVGNNISQPTSK